MNSRREGPPTEGLGHGLGRGLVSGLATTARAMLRPSHTAEYPDVKPDLPPRSRGVIALLEENCTSCMLCARECPDWCIYIDSHKETLPSEGGGRPRQRNVLDRFAIDFSLCMYCGICIEVCPFDALFWSPEFEYAEFDIRDLLHEKGRLAGWMASVPPPPAADVRAPEARELGVARAAAEKALAAHEAALREKTPPPEPAPVPPAVSEHGVAPVSPVDTRVTPRSPEAGAEASAEPEAREAVDVVPAVEPEPKPEAPATEVVPAAEPEPKAEAPATEVVPAVEPEAVADGPATEVVPAAELPPTAAVPVAEPPTEVLPAPDDTAELPPAETAPAKKAPAKKTTAKKAAPRKTTPRKTTPRKSTPRKKPPEDGEP